MACLVSKLSIRCCQCKFGPGTSQPAILRCSQSSLGFRPMYTKSKSKMSNLAQPISLVQLYLYDARKIAGWACDSPLGRLYSDYSNPTREVSVVLLAKVNPEC